MKPRKPLKRSTKPIRKVSKKRASQLRDYSKLRKEFLSKHKWCQVWLAEHNLEEKDVRESEDGRGWATPPPMRALKEVPFAIEVHHRAGRFGSRLNDPGFWLAVCLSLIHI